jgi:hypothetical protein
MLRVVLKNTVWFGLLLWIVIALVDTTLGPGIYPPKPYRVRPCLLRACTTSRAVTVLRRACSV